MILPMLSVASASILAQFGEGSTFMLPKPASSGAHHVDNLFYFIFFTCLIFFVGIVVAGVSFVILYRRTPQRMKATSEATHNTPVELAWSVGPGLLLIPMFWWGYQGFLSSRQIPEDAYEIKVHAQQWSWSFEYPNGYSGADLHVPANRKVRLLMDSADVLHSLYIPDFRVKQDLVPGRITKMWFEVLAPGEHRLYCAEYCGKDHSNMAATVVAHAPEDFPIWLANADPFNKMTDQQLTEYKADPQKFIDANPELVGLLPPVEVGRSLYRRKGCMSCHTLDGTTNTGPSWKGVWGQKGHAVLVGGAEQQVEVEENYIRESILNPGAKIVKGFSNAMTPYEGRIKDREIWAIIEFMKSLPSQ